MVESIPQQAHRPQLLAADLGGLRGAQGDLVEAGVVLVEQVQRAFQVVERLVRTAHRERLCGSRSAGRDGGRQIAGGRRVPGQL